MSGIDGPVNPPEFPWGDCCEAEDCEFECNCENHGCDDCGLSHNCRCDYDYDAWQEQEMDWDFD